MALWTVLIASSAMQPCLLAAAGAILVFLLCHVAALVHSAGRPNPSTAAAKPQAHDQSGRRHPPAPAPTRPVVSVEAFSCEAPACYRLHVEAVAQPDVPTAPDQALKRTGAGARKAAAPCSPCALGSSMLSTAHAAADGSAVIRKRPQQQHGSKSSLRAATPSPRPSTRRPAQQAAPRSPKLLHAPSISRLAPVRIDTCPDSDISAPSSSPCADSPAAFAWTGAHAEPCADLSCSASMPSHGCIEHAVDTSPVAGLLDPTQQVPAPQQGSLLQAGADNSQHALATGLGSGGSSSGNCFSTSGQDSVLLRTVLQHHAGLAQQPPAQLGATRGGFAEPMHACTGLLPAQSPAAQPGYSTAQPAMPAECTPGVLATTNRQLHVTFAPLPPSKNIWLQQLRQMSPESKNKFLRRLQSVGRKMWCMWRKRRHQHTGMDRPAHGLKRDWQQAAAESGMDSVDEPAVSPCKRLVYTGAE